MMPNLVDDAQFIITSPSRIDHRDWLAMGLFTGVTAGLMVGVDMPVYAKSKTISPSSFNLFAAPGRFYDAVDPPIFTYGGAALMVGAGYAFKDRKLALTGWTAAEAILFTQLTTGLFKTVFGRSRPYVDSGNMAFDVVEFEDLAELENESEHQSFPSGHTSKIFTLSTVVASSYDSPWVRVPAYLVAGSVAFQRIESGEHWVSDVVAGGTLGYLMGRALARKNGLVKSDSRIYPVMRGGLVGLNIRF